MHENAKYVLNIEKNDTCKNYFYKRRPIQYVPLWKHRVVFCVLFAGNVGHRPSVEHHPTLFSAVQTVVFFLIITDMPFALNFSHKHTQWRS